MKKYTTLVILLLIIFLAALSLKFGSKVTGESIDEEKIQEYTYTKAICDENNICQDFIITCKGNSTIEIKPISGAIIQHPEDWNDSRTKEEIEKIC